MSFIPIKINIFFFVLIAAIGWMSASSISAMMVWMAVVFFSVLVHELGHALTAIYFGEQVEIELHALGGVTKRFGKQPKLWQEFLIILNGPLMGFLLALGAYCLSFQSSGVFRDALDTTFIFNCFWSAFNTLPIFPLDGGHLTRIILQALAGKRGIYASLVISLVVAGLAGLLFLLFRSFIIASFFLLFAIENYHKLRDFHRLSAKDHNPEMRKLFKEAEKAMQEGKQSEALKKFIEIRKETQKGMLFTAATENMAKVFFEENRLQEVYNVLLPLRDRLSHMGLQLLHLAAYHTGYFEQAITVGNQCYLLMPHYEAAILNALCHAILGHVEPAVGWLQTAADQGCPNLLDILNKKEFDRIRDHAIFCKLTER